MGFLQRWLDEPEADIGRFAKAFYALTFLFLALFALRVVLLVVHGPQPATKGDVGQAAVALFLSSTMYALALDGRRSYKALKAGGPTHGEPLDAARKP